jgi:hypothetical protein
MKSILFVLLFGLFGYANAQEIKGGFHGGFPIGDLTDATSFNIGLDVSALFEVYDATKVGVATGYTHFFGKTVDLPVIGKVSFEDFGFLPIAAALEYNFTEDMYVGGDLGLAFALSKGTKNDISFYFQPKFGYKLTNEIDAFGSLKFIDNGTIIGVGFGYKFM